MMGGGGLPSLPIYMYMYLPCFPTCVAPYLPAVLHPTCLLSYIVCVCTCSHLSLKHVFPCLSFPASPSLPHPLSPSPLPPSPLPPSLPPSLPVLQLRRIFSDFSMFAAIFLMLLIAYLLENKITVETLVVPSHFQPSCPSERGWLINPLASGDMELWMYFAAIIPAGLVRGVHSIACVYLLDL